MAWNTWPRCTARPSAIQPRMAAPTDAARSTRRGQRALLSWILACPLRTRRRTKRRRGGVASGAGEESCSGDGERPLASWLPAWVARDRPPRAILVGIGIRETATPSANIIHGSNVTIHDWPCTRFVS